jgi:hypothetical protein
MSWRTVIVRYTVGGVAYSIETARDPGDRFLRAGDVVPIEYVVARQRMAGVPRLSRLLAQMRCSG